MAQRRKGERVLGPYEIRGRWRIIIVSADRSRVARDFETEKEARQVFRSLSREMGEVSISVAEAIERYEAYLRDEKQNKPRSIQTTIYRVRTLLHEKDLLLRELTPTLCKGYYDELRNRQTRMNRVAAVDSHRNVLAQTKTFLRWCVGRGHLGKSPLEEVQGVGRRRAGKDQLRIDEARQWYQTALSIAQAGEPGAVAALMTLLLGLRAQEVVAREVRDVDDGGHLLWIPDSKTEAGKRTLEIPEALRPLLLKLTESRDGRARLFPERDRHWVLRWVRAVCRKSGLRIVCAHAMRGLHGTMAIERGVTGHAVAAALGHESQAISFRHYVDKETAGQARQRRALTTFLGDGPAN